MCFIHHDAGIVLVLQAHYLGQVGEIAFHREHTIYHDELHLVGFATLEHTLEVGHIVVLVVQLCGKAEATAIDDARMIAIVTDDIVILAHQLRYHTAVDSETGGEHQRIVLADKLCQLLLKLYMDVQCTIEESAASTTATVLLHGFAACINNPLVASKASVSVRTKHQHVMSTHLNFSSLFSFNLTEIGIYALLFNLLCQCIERMFSELLF